MKREKPYRPKKAVKQVHFEMDLETYLDFERVVYAMGYKVSEYLRNKATEVLK